MTKSPPLKTQVVLNIILLPVAGILLCLWAAGYASPSPASAARGKMLISLAVLLPLAVVLTPAAPPVFKKVKIFCKYQFKQLAITAAGITTALALAVPAGLIALKYLFPLWCIMCSFAVLLQGLSVMYRPVCRQVEMARACAMVTGMLLIGSLFFVNPVLEITTQEAFRFRMISLVLYSNPWVVASSLAFDPGAGTMDVLQQRHMYDLSVIGSFYGQHVIKTAWITATIWYAVIGLACQLGNLVIEKSGD
ncbi:hypothetical protein ACFL54_06725 [Planctomycetota bacterium]